MKNCDKILKKIDHESMDIRTYTKYRAAVLLKKSGALKPNVLSLITLK